MGTPRFAVTVIPRFIAAIRRDYATARTCNGRTYPNRGLCHAAEALLRPALCSDEHRTWRVYHAQSRFSLRWVPHADSGQLRAAGFELAGFRRAFALGVTSSSIATYRVLGGPIATNTRPPCAIRFGAWAGIAVSRNVSGRRP